MPTTTTAGADDSAAKPGLSGQDDLRRRCRHVVAGHPEGTPGEELLRVGEWCRSNGWWPDRYGGGALIDAFEEKVAALLGKEAAVYMPSGTMAQQIALRVWSDRVGVPDIAMHPTAHLELHEQRGYARLHRLAATLLGVADRPTLAVDLDACAERIAALLVELPAREIGGQLPTWDELAELVARARARGMFLHMDGARLWEAREAYAPHTYAEVCAHFDSVYVSFYKGIGALSGSMLLGPADFVREARVWRHRHGGMLVQQHATVASAAMRLDAALARMPAYRARAQAMAAALAHVEGLRIRPMPPQVNMFHLHIAADADALAVARDRIAEEDGVWLAQRFAATPTPGWAMTELYVGDNALNVDDATIVAAFRRMLAYAHAGSS